MRLEKVAQSLINGPILIFEASPYFIISFIIKMYSSFIKVHALFNSGAFTCLIDKDFIDRKKLPLITKNRHISKEVIDGRPLVSGDVTHETTPLDIILERYHSIIAFDVIKSPSNTVVLSLS
jgi:hypothetical protein